MENFDKVNGILISQHLQNLVFEFEHLNGVELDKDSPEWVELENKILLTFKNTIL